MARIIIEKDGVTTDVAENEIANYLMLGYVRVGEMPDPPEPEVLTPEQEAVAEAAANVAEAQRNLEAAQDVNSLARQDGAAANAERVAENTDVDAATAANRNGVSGNVIRKMANDAGVRERDLNLPRNPTMEQVTAAIKAAKERNQ